MTDQRKRRVILLATHLLLGEALANILNNQDDVELIGPLVPDPEDLPSLSDRNPDLFLFINEGSDADQAVAALILSHFQDYPLLQVSTEKSLVRVYTSESHRTSSADLMETIRALPMK